MSWVSVVTAIVCEVSPELSLRPAVNGSPIFLWIVLTGYMTASEALALAPGRRDAGRCRLRSVSATGVAVTPLLTKIIFGNPLTRQIFAGIGVVLLVALSAY